MRLGAYPCAVVKGTKLYECYKTEQIFERHRHRYEFNNDFKTSFTNTGLIIGGTSPDGRLVETVELPDKKMYIGVQYHPEFKSRPNKPHPLFCMLVEKARL